MRQIRVMTFVLLALLFTGLAVAQEATEYSIWDAKHRAAVAVGGNYEWYNAQGSEPAPTFEKEFSAGGYGAWNLVPRFSLVGSSAWGFDNSFLRSTLGGSYTFFQGASFDLGAGLQYEWFYEGGDESAPAPGKEFVTMLRGGYPLNRWLIAVGSAGYGMDSKQIRSSLGLRAVPITPQ